MKPTIPKGTRDFSPQEMVKRNYIFDVIKLTELSETDKIDIYDVIQLTKLSETLVFL